MHTLLHLLFACTLVLSGGYAGLLLMCQIGVTPTLRRLSLPAYVDTFRTMDYWMGRRMPAYKISLLLLSIATLIVAAITHHPQLAGCLGLSLALNLSDLILNVRIQLPHNKQVCETPANTPASTLQAFLDKTATFFTIRFYLSFTAFALLCFAVVFTPLN